MASPPPEASSPSETTKDQTNTRRDQTKLLIELQGDVDDRAEEAKEEEGTLRGKFRIISSKEWKSGEAGRVKQSIEVFTDYMKMIDRRN
jgi:phage tail tube protein FII